MRSQNRLTALNASFTPKVGSPKCSSCCNTGSGRRVKNASPHSINTGNRLAWANAAEVSKFAVPGPALAVQNMNRRRSHALAYPAAAKPMPCSFWPRYKGKVSCTSCNASPRQVTLPWPKMPKPPPHRRMRCPSISMNWAFRNFTTAWAVVRVTVFVAISASPPLASAM